MTVRGGSVSQGCGSRIAASGLQDAVFRFTANAVFWISEHWFGGLCFRVLGFGMLEGSMRQGM